MAQSWFIRHGDREEGPLTPIQLRQLVAEGLIGPDTLLRLDGASSTIPARRVKGLLPATAAPGEVATLASPAPAPAPAADDPVRALAASIGLAADQNLFAGGAAKPAPATTAPAAAAAATTAPPRFDPFERSTRPAPAQASAHPSPTAAAVPLEAPDWRRLWPLAAMVIGLGWIGGGIALAGRHLAPDSVGVVFLLALASVPLAWIAFAHWLRPRRVPTGTAIGVGVFTAIGGIFLLLVLQWLASLAAGSRVRVHGKGAFIWLLLVGIALLYAMTDSDSIAVRWIGYVFGVGLLEEMTKLLPLAWLVLQRCDRRMGVHTFLALGFCSGLGFGITEAFWQYNPWNGVTGFDDNAVRWFACVPSHALWTAMSAAFLWKLGDRLEHADGFWGRAGVIALAAGAMALLHGTYNTVCSLGTVTAMIGDALSFVALVLVVRWITRDASDPVEVTEQPAAMAVRGLRWPVGALGAGALALGLAFATTISAGDALRARVPAEYRAYLEPVAPPASEPGAPARCRFQLVIGEDATTEGIVGTVENAGAETLGHVVATCVTADGEARQRFDLGDIAAGGRARIDPGEWPFDRHERVLLSWDGHEEPVEFVLP